MSDPRDPLKTLEQHHNNRFHNYMDRFLPNWREYDALLQQPLA